MIFHTPFPRSKLPASIDISIKLVSLFERYNKMVKLGGIVMDREIVRQSTGKIKTAARE
jgi:hypothetical protein